MADAEQFAIDHAHHLAADLVRVAFGIKPGLNFRPSRPGPELLFLLGIGVGLLESQPRLLDAQTAGAEVPTPQAHDIMAKIAQASQFGVRVVIHGGEGMGDGGIAERNPLGEAVGERARHTGG